MCIHTLVYINTEHYKTNITAKEAEFRQKKSLFKRVHNRIELRTEGLVTNETTAELSWHSHAWAHSQNYTHTRTQKRTVTPQPTGPWAPLRMDRIVGSTFSALSLCLRPLSTDSCFLTKPTLFQADPVIMRLCPELQATREQCQQLGADLLNGLASPRSPREQKLHLIVWVESRSLPRGIAHVQY